MSFLDLDEALLPLFERIELDRTPLNDVKELGPCDVGLVEGGLCNAENVAVLREFRARCKVLVAVGACAINGGLPAQRNALDVGQMLVDVYRSRPGLAPGSDV
ncbi:MAG: NADP oxidoreductase, partial [Rhodoferax sp.]|nr:NADP oxidoreductase [Rhodoferax sp.]